MITKHYAFHSLAVEVLSAITSDITAETRGRFRGIDIVRLEWAFEGFYTKRHVYTGLIVSLWRTLADYCDPERANDQDRKLRLRLMKRIQALAIRTEHPHLAEIAQAKIEAEKA